MKTLWLALLMSALATISAGQSAQLNGKSQAERDNLRVIQGCLSYANETYVITGGGPQPKQYRITGGDTGALNGKLQYTVKVTGVLGKNSPELNMTTPYNEGTTTGAGWNTIDVQAIEIVYANCSGSGKEQRVRQ